MGAPQPGEDVERATESPLCSPRRRGGGGEDGGTLLKDLGAGAWLYPALFLSIVALCITAPFLPDIQTNFFASRGGPDIRCQDFAAGQAPPACVEAHSTVTRYSATSSFFSNSVIAVVSLPYVGTLSDRYGRRRFLVAAQVLNFIPLACLALYFNMGWVSLVPFYVANALSGAKVLIAVSFAYLADAVAPERRTVAFGLAMACFSAGFLVGPVLGLAMTPTTAVWVAAGGAAANVLFMIALVPEPARHHAGGEVEHPPGGAKAPGGLRLLARSPLFRRLTLVVMLVGMSDEGLQNCLTQYLQLRMAFKPSDLVMIFIVLGLGGLLVQGVLLRPLKAALGDRGLLAAALAAAAAGNLALAAASSKGGVLLSIAILTLDEASVPAISALKANNASPSEQGTVQGALYGARSLAQGLGPLLYSAVFTAFTTGKWGLPHAPGAPFILGAGLCGAAILVAATITGAMDNGQGGGDGGGGRGGEGEGGGAGGRRRSRVGGSDESERGLLEEDPPSGAVGSWGTQADC